MGVTRSPTAAPFAAWLADNLSSMPAAVTPSPASAAEAVCPENRVKALDFLAWPRIGVQGPETPDTRWGNRPRYDGKAVGSVLARYYDPATGQFLTVDPDVATTLSPYGYVQGDPLNSTDPTGDCGLWGSDTCWSDIASAARTAWNAVTSPGGRAVLDQAAQTAVPLYGALRNSTVGICFGGSAGLLLAGTAQACIVVSHLQQIGTTETLGGGVGFGLDAGPSLQISNARNVNDLGGPFGWASGAWAPVGASGFLGAGCGGYPVAGANVGPAAGFFFGGGAEYTWTQTWLRW